VIMGDIAIKVEKLSKQYMIGGAKPAYQTLRDNLADAVSAPVRRFAGLIRGESYGAADLHQSIWALKDINLSINQGDVIGIIGRNGAGKSTLLKILSRITDPTEGRVLINGRVGSLLEVGTGFHPELSGRENIYLNGSILGMKREEISTKFDEIVAFSGVEKFLDTPIKFYSSGMQVRLAFSVAAHLEPEILLIDEVLAVGDASFRKKCLGKMKDVTGQGRTVMYVSHNMASILSLCDRTILLDQGKIAMSGKSSDVVAHYLSVNRETIDSTVNLNNHSGRSDESAKVMEKLSLFDGKLQPVNSVKVGEDLIIDLIIDTKNRTIEEPRFIINVVNLHGLSMCKLRSYIMTDQVTKMTGKNIIRFLWKGVNLSPGIYVLNVQIRDKLVRLDKIIDALSFQVQAHDIYQTGRVDSTPGLIVPFGEWSVTKI